MKKYSKKSNENWKVEGLTELDKMLLKIIRGRENNGGD